MHGKSQIAKSAAQVFAGSIFGNSKYIKHWNATLNGIESLASAHNDLPLILDETKLSKQEMLGQHVRRYCEGMSRIKQNKNSILKEIFTWRGCILSTGETPIANSDSQHGESTRTIDYCSKGVRPKKTDKQHIIYKS